MSGERKEIILKGIPVSPGVAYGPAFIFARTEMEIPCYSVAEDKRDEEITRFERSLLETRRQITGIRSEIEEKLGEQEALIFDAHLMVLEDKALIEETIAEVIESGNNIEYCFHRVTSRFLEAFSKIGDEYIKERMTDIRDVSRRLLANMLGKTEFNVGRLAVGRVLVAKDLTPSDTASMEKGSVLAIVTDQGSRTSHAAIMARSVETPAVVGTHDLSERLEPESVLLVDGYEGLVIINPSTDTLFRYGKIRIERQHLSNLFQSSLRLPSKTRDDHFLPLYLNIEGQENPAHLIESGAEGVGLYRTESLFLRQDTFPSEEEQYQAYKRIVEGLAPRPVTIRTLDLGGDKLPKDGMEIGHEANPFLGLRAIRYCLENLPVFHAQLRAIVRASAHGQIKVLFPMISGVEELLEARKIFEEVRAQIRQAGLPMADSIPIGAMIEIPSAAFSADILAQSCDFFSIGTNDLIQYLLAVDRVNDRIAHLYQPDHPAVVRTLKLVFDAAKQRQITVSVCGEMAGDPVYVPLLYGLGADELSMTPSSIPEVKYLIRNMSFAEASELAKKALTCTRSNEVSDLLRTFYFERVTTDSIRAS